MLTLSSGLIRLWKDPFAGMGDVLLEHAEERLAKGSERQADNLAGGKRHQHLVRI